ncbi:MAG: di-heme oxidoredictase family protein [Polyangiales bacterium]|nr:hypothetical protein [Myxococcales bacterium]MCB9656051.1 hypothetical protein [Sandaracinaceae bacterium]
MTDTLESASVRDLSGIAGPSDPSRLQPLERIPRDVFGSANTADALTFSTLGREGRALFDMDDRGSPLSFFNTEQTPRDGLGPVFNQARCLGCHQNSDDLADALGDSTGVTTVSTPASRAGRTGVTDHDAVSVSNPPPTAAFTLFGDFDTATGEFFGLQAFGGPVRHVQATGECQIDGILPESADPFLASPNRVRAVAERAGPPYLGRGVIEAIYEEDIRALQDAEDADTFASSLAPPPGPDCRGDCITGRINQNRASNAIQGGDTVTRLSRFGLRAAGPTLVQFMVGGSQGELGMTSPLSPQEPSNPVNVGLRCDTSPDPELTVPRILALRAMIRLIGVPDFDPALLASPDSDPRALEVREGARLFGLDLDAFRTRMTPGMAPAGLSEDAEHGIAADRGLGCVSCHTPVQRTGASPASIGADELSHRWAPVFSDLLIHDMGRVPADLGADELAAWTPAFEGIDRNLADFALPGQGLAQGPEWRTAPMMGIGRIGPPFLHDGRVFLNPDEPAFFYYGSRTADEAGIALVDRRVPIVTLEQAFQAAIELHDLPQPPDFDLNGVPDYDVCPPVPDARDVCSRDSAFRSEARNVMEKWHALTDAQQRAVVRFLMAL